MPAPGVRGATARKSAFRLRGKSARSVDGESTGSPSECGEFLHIGPALAGQATNANTRKSLGPRAHSTLGNFVLKNASKLDHLNGHVVPLQALTEGPLQSGGQILKDKEKFIDRINLDRRGLSSIPPVVSESALRLLSLQHNLLSSLSGLSSVDLTSLVFLDVYDNQIEKISFLDTLHSLRVLLMGKNRIRRIEGLSNATKLEVLDLHGNRITQANGLRGLNELKVLNLAGNQLRTVELLGLPELRELNLKRNRLRKLTGCDGVPKIQKMFLNNNDLQSIDDISSVALAVNLREITLDNNPISLGGDCISFLVSYLPNLVFLSQMQVTDQVRRAAMAWRHNKEVNNAAYMESGELADANSRREQVISNARTNWELLRTQSKCLTSTTTYNVDFTPDPHLETNGSSRIKTLDVIKTNPRLQLNKSLMMNNNNTNQKQNVRPKTTQKLTAGTPTTDSSKSSNLPGNINANGFGERRVNFSHRSTSQDTDVSHSTSTSSELFKLPPILVPIIDSLEHPKLNLGPDSPTSAKKTLNRWESISSVDPVLNSSMSSLPTTTSESESEAPKKPICKRTLTATKKRASFAASKSVSIADTNSNTSKTPVKNRSISDNSENMSVISTGTNLNSVITNSSTSGSDRIGRKENASRAGSAKARNIKSATTIRRNLSRQIQNRAVTAKPKQMKTTTVDASTAVTGQVETIVKDREQGGDWLIEVKGGQASVWGAGALRRLEKAWPSANEVNTIHFHYVNFASICTVLPTIKNRFPNAVHFTFRACGLSCAGQLGALAALRGIVSLTLHREGNPLAAHSWHSYALYRLAHWGLRRVDHVQVTDEEIALANEEYSGLSDVVLWSLPDSLLQPLLMRLQGDKDGSNNKQLNEKESPKYAYERKDGNFVRRKDNVVAKKENENDAIAGAARYWLWNADSALRDVVAREALQWRRNVMSQEEVVLRHRGRTHLGKVLCNAAGAAVKLRLLRRHWPSILLHLLTMIMYDFSKLQVHVDEKIKDMMENLPPEIPLSRRNKET